MNLVFALLTGGLFGMVLTKSEVASWFRIQKMFRFEEAHMFLIIGSAVAVGAISILLIKKLGLRTLAGNEVSIREKAYHKGVVIGGMIFGVGWVITGACPGPIYAQIGSGELWAICSFLGAFSGAYLYAWLRPHLPH